MKTFFEILEEAAVEAGDISLSSAIKLNLDDEHLELLTKAAGIYAKQSNSHKHGVSGKRLIQLQIDLENVTIHLNQICRALEQIQAACASGAVEKGVSEGLNKCTCDSEMERYRCRKECDRTH